MMWLEIGDVMFFIKQLRAPVGNFDISEFLSFTASSTRSSTYLKLQLSRSPSNLSSHFYFCRFPRLWNALPPMDLSLSIPTLRRQLLDIFWFRFINSFDSDNPHSFHYLCPCTLCKCIPKGPVFSHSLS